MSKNRHRTGVLARPITVRFHGVLNSRRFAHQTLNAPRGWSLGERVHFVKDHRCPRFHISLATPDRLGSFGCTTAGYSFRSASRVNINVFRWRHGIRSFHDDRYRHMLVQPEVGHRLEFGHSNGYCSAVKRNPAPIMIQHSGGRRGCTSNGWPLAAEYYHLLTRLHSGWRPSSAPGTVVVRPVTARIIAGVGGLR